MKRLSPVEELSHLKSIQADPVTQKAYSSLLESFSVLQVRSQMLLGLVTICLTITGFSGLQIAQSGMGAKVCIFIGVVCTLLTALLLVVGPLQLRWLTQMKGEDVDSTLIELIHRRNKRTRIYHLAIFVLLVGFSSYVLSLGFFLLRN